MELTAADAQRLPRGSMASLPLLIVFPTANANIVETSADVNDALGDLTDMVGEGAAFTTIFDQAPFITTSIQALAQEGGMGLIMAVAVILIFLVSIRPTLVRPFQSPSRSCSHSSS